MDYVLYNIKLLSLHNACSTNLWMDEPEAIPTAFRCMEAVGKHQ
jgi:hypothetical protein